MGIIKGFKDLLGIPEKAEAMAVNKDLAGWYYQFKFQKRQFFSIDKYASSEIAKREMQAHIVRLGGTY